MNYFIIAGLVAIALLTHSCVYSEGFHAGWLEHPEYQAFAQENQCRLREVPIYTNPPSAFFGDNKDQRNALQRIAIEQAAQIKELLAAQKANQSTEPEEPAAE
jgi:hypothetical protein